MSQVVRQVHLQRPQGLGALFAFLSFTIKLYADVLELFLEVGDMVPGATVVPYDSVGEWFSGLAAPDNSGLALVGDTCNNECQLSAQCE